ncbi:hypothetical protein [Viscerimonas tarda]
MILNKYGKVVKDVWNELPMHYFNIELDEFVIMPNHFHGIIAITEDVGVEYFRPEKDVIVDTRVENIRPLRERSNCESGSYIESNPFGWLNDKFYTE